MDLSTILILIGLVLAIVCLFVDRYAFRLLAAGVICIGAGLLIPLVA